MYDGSEDCPIDTTVHGLGTIFDAIDTASILISASGHCGGDDGSPFFWLVLFRSGVVEMRLTFCVTTSLKIKKFKKKKKNLPCL